MCAQVARQILQLYPELFHSGEVLTKERARVFVQFEVQVVLLVQQLDRLRVGHRVRVGRGAGALRANTTS